MDVDEISPMEHARALETAAPQKAIAAYNNIAFGEYKSETAIKDAETAIAALGNLYSKLGMVQDLIALVERVKSFIDVLSKARGGQLFKSLVDQVVDMAAAPYDTKVELCKASIAWAQEQKRTFLRQSLEVRLIWLHLDGRQYQAALVQMQPLLKELKQLDDKLLLVDVQLSESKAYYALDNYPKARAALVSARTTANGVYCPPRVQACLDMQSGVLHSQEGDFKTGYSYFYEAFEGFDSIDDKEAILGLKYMLLSKIMLQEAADVPSIISGKLALRYSGADLEAMQAVATAALNRSLAEFEKTLERFPKELKDDVIIRSHLSDVYNTLLVSNLVRIVEPFSRVEIEHVASIINLPLAVVEGKLSQMILDKQLNGILDQGTGCLELFDPQATDAVYASAIDVITETGRVVDALYKKAQKLV